MVPSLVLHSAQYCQRELQKAPVCPCAPLLETHSRDPSHPDPSPGDAPKEFPCHPVISLTSCFEVLCFIFYKLPMLSHMCGRCHCHLLLFRPVRLVCNIAIATEPSGKPINRKLFCLPLMSHPVSLDMGCILFCFDGFWSLGPGIAALRIHVSHLPFAQNGINKISYLSLCFLVSRMVSAIQ